MKISNKKIIVSTLALAMGAALAGSISGSVAWYQYSTRAAALVAGTSAGTSRDLQVAIKPSSGSASYSHFADLGSKNFRPTSIVADASGKAVSSFVDHPVYQYPDLPALAAENNEKETNGVTTVGYYEFELVFKCEDSTSATKAQVAKEVYLTKLEIVNKGSTTNDVTPAVRIAIDGTNDFIVAKTAGATTTEGTLDIGGETGTDTDYWDCQDDEQRVTDGVAENVTYSNGAASYTSVAPSSVIAGDTDPYLFTNKENRLLTTTATGTADSAPVKFQVWLEGWQSLGGKTVWDKEYQAQDFEIQMVFACEADK